MAISDYLIPKKPQDVGKIAGAGDSLLGMLAGGKGFNTAAGATGPSWSAGTAAFKKAPAVAPGFMELLKGKDWKGLMKSPGGMIAGLMLAQIIYGHLKGKVGGARQEGLQQDVIEQQAGMSEEDAYYQAALPSLTQERQGAQMALMQAILGGGQQAVQVPGERRI